MDKWHFLMTHYRLLTCVSFVSTSHFHQNNSSTSLPPFGNEYIAVFKYFIHTKDQANKELVHRRRDKQSDQKYCSMVRYGSQSQYIDT